MEVLEVLSFLEKDDLHNNASSYYNKTNKKYGAGIEEPQEQKTVYEIAVELEEKYHVVSTFLEKYKDDISFFIAKEKMYISLHPEEEDKTNIVIANHIKGLWLDFMENGEYTQMTGFISKRVQEKGGKTFIDTSDYYQSMEIDYNGEKSNAGL